jgi:hypothetical protein
MKSTICGALMMAVIMLSLIGFPAYFAVTETRNNLEISNEEKAQLVLLYRIIPDVGIKEDIENELESYDRVTRKDYNKILNKVGSWLLINDIKTVDDTTERDSSEIPRRFVPPCTCHE